jgi:REP element-mobilizing transposase RayT
MGRVHRTGLPDGYFHVSARGVAGRGQLFEDDDDRRRFLELLAESVERYDWRCHALCLMGTHYHLVVEARRDALSAGIQRLHCRYAVHFNKKRGLFGHVFASRFSARVIASERYLQDACTYVLLNPVRAGLCHRLDEWPWSYSRYAPEPD